MEKRPRAGPIITRLSDIWEKYLHLGVKRTYPANHTLLYPGESPGLLYYIQSGEVLISNYASPDSRHLFILRSGSILGLIGMFTPDKAMVSWLTLEPCTCYLFTKKDIYEKAPRDLLLNMLEQMGAMSSSMTRRFVCGNAKRLDVQLACLLVHLVDTCRGTASQTSGGLCIKPSITQEMVSELLGMHPVTLNRLIASLRAEGILGRFTKKKLEILDYKKLEEYAAGRM